MATKDWEKKPQYSNSRQMVWKNKKNGDLLRVYHKPGLKFYDVRDKNGKIIYEKEFKTKYQAVSYAKKYMSRN